jgi:hypothetical protein
MKILLKIILLILCLGNLLPLVQAELVWPESPSVERYQPIWTRSPFTVSSATPEEVASGKWVLVGLALSPDDPMVFILNRETQERRIITSSSTDKDFSIDSIDQQSDYLKSSVRLKTPTELITVRFDAALIAESAAAMAVAPSEPNTSVKMNRQPPSRVLSPTRRVNRITMPAPPPAPSKK